MPSHSAESAHSALELPQVLLEQTHDELPDGVARQALEQNVLPGYLPKRRWFAGKGSRIDNVSIDYAVRFGDGGHPVAISEIEVTAGGSVARYQLPFGLIDDSQAASELAARLAIAHFKSPDHHGLITDAFTLEPFIRAVVKAMQDSTHLNTKKGPLQFLPGPGLAALNIGTDAEVRYLSAEQSNSSVVVGGRLILKMIRRVNGGIHPELEVGGYLTEKGYPNISPLLGSLNRIDAEGIPHLLMIAQGYLANQGDAWEWSLATLERAICAVEGDTAAFDELVQFSGKLGQRLAEMHGVLAQPSENPDFGAELTSVADTQVWAVSVRHQVERALSLLAQHQAGLEAPDRAFVARLLTHKDALLSQIDRLAARTAGGLRIRVHGDLHLGQVLVVDGDAYLIDFEGEPVRALHERRGKYSPFKDVTGVLRSIEYAAAMAVRSPPDDLDRSERQAIAEHYRVQARAAFLDAYRLAAADLPHTWQERDGEGAALELFSVEKAAYEIIYEAENRPTWLAVPLQGLLGLAQQIADGEK